jgi:hypothetical protein
MTWTESENPFSGGVGLGIAWSSSQNKWVAVSNASVCIATSTDGITWEASQNPFSGGGASGIACSANKWVAVGVNVDNTVSIATSPDGVIWTDSSNNPFFGGPGSGIAYSSSQDKWVAVGRNVDYTVCIATSTDGMTWTDSSNNPFIVAYAVTWSSSINQWVAVGQSSDSTVSIATSPDGMTWTDASNNPFSGGDAYGVAASPPPSIQPMANARMNIGFTAPLTPSLGGAMRGYIYEILCYRGAVSPSDQQKIEGYLAWKWGIQDSLPGTHPYYLGPP